MQTVDDWLLAEGYGEVSPIDFYREVFPKGSLDKPKTLTKGKYRAILIQVNESNSVLRHFVCDDLAQIELMQESEDFFVMSPIGYAGKKQSRAMARELYAIAFDLDGLRIDNNMQFGLSKLFEVFNERKELWPTYIVSSGTGIHVYYLLDKPYKMFPEAVSALYRFRVNMTRILWDYSVSELYNKPQYESPVQGFRCVGSACKDKSRRVRAYKVGERVSIESLNAYFTNEDGSPIEKLQLPTQRKTRLSLADAKKKYPDWYQKRIVKGVPRNTWQVKRDLYDWWKRQIVQGTNKNFEKESGAIVGHRYFAIMALAIYARKCGISREELEKDAFSFIPYLDSKTKEASNHFDKSDVMKALNAYDLKYITFPRASIELLTNIAIPANKRNHRKRQQHMAYLNALRKMRRDVLGEDEYANVGRPNKQKQVVEYLQENPDASVRQASRELGISKATVQKWFKLAKETSESNESN